VHVYRAEICTFVYFHNLLSANLIFLNEQAFFVQVAYDGSKHLVLFFHCENPTGTKVMTCESAEISRVFIAVYFLI
jgi:hypothetical protein